MVNFKMIWSCENWLVGFKRSRIFYSESLWDKDRENKMFAIVSARIAYWMMWFGGGGDIMTNFYFIFLTMMTSFSSQQPTKSLNINCPKISNWDKYGIRYINILYQNLKKGNYQTA